MALDRNDTPLRSGAFAFKELSMKIRAVHAGQTFGLLTVIEVARKAGKQGGQVKTFCLCSCVCGNITSVAAGKLKSGLTKSCGCLLHKSRKTGPAENESIEYCSWEQMKQRCLNPRNHAYHHYGGRGIQVCERWQHSYQNFLEDMGRRPSKSHSIDRVDNDGNYEPENCRWATAKEQRHNSRQNRLIAFKGKTMCVAEWAKAMGIDGNTLLERLKRWSIEKSLTTPVRPRRCNLSAATLD